MTDGFTPTLQALPQQPQYATPGNYVSPAQQKAQMDYAAALRNGNGQQPVHHWTQGVSNMFAALMGHNLNEQTAQRENAANDLTGNRMTVPVPGTQPLQAQPPVPYTNTGTPSPKDAPSSGGDQNTDDNMGKEANAIASIESKGSGDYSAVGPATRAGDRAYGKYQVMGANVGPWTKEVLGKEMTPQEFLSNQAAQDKVFQTKFAQGGNNDSDRASMWFTGKPLAQGAGRSDGNLTGAQYVAKFNSAMGAPQAGGAMAFAGPSNASEAPAQAAITAAVLRGQHAVPGGTPQYQEPAGGQIYVDPKLAPRVPQISQDQIRGIMSDPRIPWERKMQYQGMYLQQGQPVPVPYPGGKVLIDPLNPSKQQFVPDLQNGIKKLPGGLEKPYPYTVMPGPNGTVIQSPANVPVPAGPQSNAAPTAAPAGAPAPAAAPGPVTAQTAPQAPVTPPEMPPQAPVQVASLDPTAGVAKAAGQEPLTPTEQQLMALAKQGQPASPAATPVAAQEPAPAPQQVAANGVAPPTNPLAQAIRTKPPSSDYSDEDWKSITGYQDLDRQNAIDKEAGIKGVDASMKKYDTLSTQAQTARKLMPSIDTALALMKDPNFDSGIGSNEVLSWNKLKSAFPSLFGEGAQFSAAPNEVFNKVVAGSILDNMRTALGGLGQVRLAEIDLLKQASASNNNTPAANRALLELSRRSLQQLDHIDEMGQAYQSGDEVLDPITGKTLLPANLNTNGEPQPRRGLDVGFDKLARQFVLDHPTTTPAEAADYKKLFSAGAEGLEPSTAPKPGAVPPKVTTQEEYNALPPGPYIAPDGSQRIKK